jgi:membrane protein YqaA with SNARE-associated domain
MTLEAAAPRSIVRRCYDWAVAAADKPHAMWTMGAISFAESSFFPVPPDVMLIPMALARPERAYVMALWCTLSSVAGGLVGYAIGALLYDSVGHWLIPYKIVTITSGFAAYPLLLFVVFSIIARGMRFFVLAFLLHRYGERARGFIEHRLGLWVAIGAAVVVIGIVAALYLV